MNKDLYIRLRYKQIEAYNTVIRTLEELKPLMLEHDGMRLNVKFKRLVEELFNDNENVCVAVTTSKNDGSELAIRVHKDYVKDRIDVEYGIVSYIDERYLVLTLASNECEKLNNEFATKQINNEIEKLNTKIKHESICIEVYDKCENDMIELKEKIEEINKQYPFELRQTIKQNLYLRF